VIFGTDKRTPGRRLARYIAGLVLAVLERDGLVAVSQVEARCADAFDAHGLKLARAAGCKTAQVACARWCGTVVHQLGVSGFVWRNVTLGYFRLHGAARCRWFSVGTASRLLGVGRSTVRRWVKVGQVRMLADGRVALWVHALHCFPRRPRLYAAPHEQGDAAQSPEPVPVLQAAAPKLTDDDLTRLQAAAVNMVEDAQPIEPAPYTMTVPAPYTMTARTVATFKAPILDGVERRADGFDSAGNALRFAQTLQAAARWAMGDG